MKTMDFSEDFAKKSLFGCLIIIGLLFLGLAFIFYKLTEINPNIFSKNIYYWLVIVVIFIITVTIGIIIIWKIEKMIILAWLLNIEDEDWRVFHWEKYYKSNKFDFNELLILLAEKDYNFYFFKGLFNTNVLIIPITLHQDVKLLIQSTSK